MTKSPSYIDQRTTYPVRLRFVDWQSPSGPEDRPSLKMKKTPKHPKNEENLPNFQKPKKIQLFRKQTKSSNFWEPDRNFQISKKIPDPCKTEKTPRICPQKNDERRIKNWKLAVEVIQWQKVSKKWTSIPCIRIFNFNGLWNLIKRLLRLSSSTAAGICVSFLIIHRPIRLQT